MLWALVDQGCSSLASFVLTLVAARMLGPSGVGVVYVGFTVYLLALGLQRALIGDPLVVVSATLGQQQRSQTTRAATTATLALGVGISGLAVAAGLLLPSDVGRGLALFAPWIAPALLHDLFRTALFRDERGAHGAQNAVAWLVVMAAALVGAWRLPTGWTVVGAWGLGGLAGAVLGAGRTRAWPQRPTTAWRWWREHAWPLGRWLGIESSVLNIRLQVTTLLLAGVLGVGPLGGLRAAQSLFAAMTLVGPALSMAGLPAITRLLAESTRAARTLAFRISAVAVAIVAAYLVVVGSFRSQAMQLVFGPEFAAFAHLVIPIGVVQLLAGADVGFALFLKACAEGRKLLWAQLAYSISMFVLSLALALRYGVEGAVWGFLLASVVGVGLVVLFALRAAAGRVHRSAESPAGR
jgi:O-antigen/teichoic acid export membrane protein